jgi:hypothetical protein
MNAAPSSSPAPTGPSTPTGFALPGRLLVVLVFMTQFIALLLGLGILLPYLHQNGVNTVVLALGAIASFLALQAGLGVIMRLIPVRCLSCGGRSYFAGFGWWPFIYRSTCGSCGMQRRLEVGGR